MQGFRNRFDHRVRGCQWISSCLIKRKQYLAKCLGRIGKKHFSLDNIKF